MSRLALSLVNGIHRIRKGNLRKIESHQLPGTRKSLNRGGALLKTEKDVPFKTSILGGVDCEHHQPTDSCDTVILYLHGGAYVMGSPSSHRSLISRISARTGCEVFAIDYRLAPEAPFPAAVEDAFSAYQELISSRDPRQVIVMGDSAGGGLAASLLLQNKRSAVAQPLCSVLMSPWVDLHCNAPSFIANERSEAMLPLELLFKGAKHYLGALPATEPLASPIFGPMKGLPPLMIQVSGAEVLLDDSRMLAKKAEEAGVDVQLDIWPGCPHVWQMLWSVLPQGREAIDEIAVFVTEQIENGNRSRSMDSAALA